MTTIVYRDGMIVADKQITDSGQWAVSWNMNKIFATNVGVLCCSGPIPQIIALREQFKTWGEMLPRFDKESLIFDEWGIEGFIIVPSGIGYDILDHGILAEMSDMEFAAIGGGKQYALGAMHAGAGALDAFHIAARYHNGTGSGFDTLEIGEYYNGQKAKKRR